MNICNSQSTVQLTINLGFYARYFYIFIYIENYNNWLYSKHTTTNDVSKCKRNQYLNRLFSNVVNLELLVMAQKLYRKLLRFRHQFRYNLIPK